MATASGSIRNFPFSSQYTRRIGLGGPVAAEDDAGEVGGCDLGDGEAEVDGESLVPRLKKPLISTRLLGVSKNLRIYGRDEIQRET